MGGKVGVVSKIDTGSTFWVELRLAAEGDGKRIPEPPPAGLEYRQGTEATVLYVEDNMANVRLMERVLSRRPSLKLLTSTDGRSGLAHALARAPRCRAARSPPARSDRRGGPAADSRRPDAQGRRSSCCPPMPRPARCDGCWLRARPRTRPKPFNINEVLSVVDRLLSQRAMMPREPEPEHRE